MAASGQTLRISRRRRTGPIRGIDIVARVAAFRSLKSASTSVKLIARLWLELRRINCCRIKRLDVQGSARVGASARRGAHPPRRADAPTLATVAQQVP